MDTINRTLGARESRLLCSAAEKGFSVLTTDDAREIMGEEKVLLILSRLSKKRWLKRLEKGKYLILPLSAGPKGLYCEDGFVLADKLVSPYTIAYWSALNFYGYTEQIPYTVFVATTKRKKDLEIEDLGLRFKFVTILEKKFFGNKKRWIGSKQVIITDREKTIVDCLDHPQYCGGIVEATKGVWEGFTQRELEPKTVTEYADRMGNRTIFKRLGFLAETLSLPVDDFLPVWREKISTGYTLLCPLGLDDGEINTGWNLKINVDKNELTEWRFR